MQCILLSERKQSRGMMGAVCPGVSPLSGRVIAGAGPVCQGNEAEVRDSEGARFTTSGDGRRRRGPAPPDRD